MLRVDISSKQVEVTDRLEKYIVHKVGNLEKYLPRQTRGGARATVRLSHNPPKGEPGYSCEIILYTPHDDLVAHETTRNVFAAVDVAIARIKEQIPAYKTKNGFLPLRNRLWHRR